MCGNCEGMNMRIERGRKEGEEMEGGRRRRRGVGLALCVLVGECRAASLCFHRQTAQSLFGQPPG